MNEAFALGISAFGLGVLHAFEPGHGKTLMAGTLVNARRTWKDPFLLACSTALGHMFGVLLFATASFFLAHEFVDGRARFYFEFLVGFSVAFVGLLLWCRSVGSRDSRARTCSCCAEITPRSSCSSGGIDGKHLGVVGMLVGLVPCPTVLTLAASTASLGSISQALSVAFVFGLGVSVSLLLIGISITLSAHRLHRLSGLGRFARYAEQIGPLSLIVVGAMIALHAGEHAH